MTTTTAVFGTTTRIRSDGHNKARVWAARALGGLALAFLFLDTAIKLTGHPAVSASFTRLGFDAHTGTLIGIIELFCLAVFLSPRTRLLGAVILTGYLGGAVATHVRIGDPLFSHVLFPIYIAALLWSSLYLRDTRVRALLG